MEENPEVPSLETLGLQIHGLIRDRDVTRINEYREQAAGILAVALKRLKETNRDPVDFVVMSKKNDKLTCHPVTSNSTNLPSNVLTGAAFIVYHSIAALTFRIPAIVCMQDNSVEGGYEVQIRITA